MILRIHSLLESSRVNGPGQRAVIWFQGCSLGCVACWNPGTHERFGGRDLTIGSLVAWVHTLWSKGAISGLTISGGEPMEQAPGLAEFMEKVRQLLPDLSIGLFSGYSDTELNRGRHLCFPSTAVGEKQQLWRRIRSCLDFAVLGRYNTMQPASDPLVTSKNQRLRIYSERHGYAAFEAQCVEVTIDHQGLTQITGFPVRGVAAV